MKLDKIFFVFVAFSLFMLPNVMGATNLIDNGDFQSNHYVDSDFCCDGLFGSGVSTVPVYVPRYWNDSEYGVHVRTTYNDLDESYTNKAMEVYTHKPSNWTMWSGGCTQVNITNGGTATYHEPIEVENSSVVILADVRKCTYYIEKPIKCSGSFENQENFMGSANNSGIYFINTYWDNGTDINSIPSFNIAQDFWQTVSVDYSEIDYPNGTSFPQNLTLSLGAGVESFWGDEASCVVFDNVRVEYTSGSDTEVGFAQLSFVDDYIEDMFTFWGTLYDYEMDWDEKNPDCDNPTYPITLTDISFDEFNFETSKGFAGVPLANVEMDLDMDWNNPAKPTRIEWSESCGSGDANVDDDDYIYLVYDDGTNRSVGDELFLCGDASTTQTGYCAGGTGTNMDMNMNYIFPLYDYEDLDHIEMRFSVRGYQVADGIHYECANIYLNITPDISTIETRQIYSNPEDTANEETTGYNDFYPLFPYRGIYDSENVSFNAFLFPMNGDESSLQNMRLYAYTEEGSFKNIATDSLNFYDENGNFNTIQEGESIHWCRYNMSIFYQKILDFDLSESNFNEISFMEMNDGETLELLLVSDTDLHSDVMQNASIEWEVGDEVGATFCSDYCDENDTLWDGYFDEYGICRYDLYYDSTTCTDGVIVDNVYAQQAEEALAGVRNATMELGAYAEETWDILDMSFDDLTKLLISILVSMAIGISAMVKLKENSYSHVLGVIGVLGGFMFFLFYGWMPIWIGIILILIAGFLLVRAIVSVFLG